MTSDATELRELIDRALDEREQRDGFNKKNKITIIAWDGHLDRVWPTLILSTTAAASGMQVSVFFTFWGLFALVKPEKRITGKDWMTKMLSVMNPGSTSKAKLSRYNFAGMGPWMLGKLAEDYKTPHPTELLEMARGMGVRLIPCQMTMDLMGLTRDDLLDGLEEPIGAATALLEMKESAIQLFI
jgi:peroxiredoxin family protein